MSAAVCPFLALSALDDLILFSTIERVSCFLTAADHSLVFTFLLWSRNRLWMILWNICFAKNDVALRTNKGGVILLLLDLEIQGPSVICGGRDVTSISAPQRTDRNLHSFRIYRIERCHIMAVQAIQVGCSPPS